MAVTFTAELERHEENIWCKLLPLYNLMYTILSILNVENCFNIFGDQETMAVSQNSISVKSRNSSVHQPTFFLKSKHPFTYSLACGMVVGRETD